MSLERLADNLVVASEVRTAVATAVDVPAGKVRLADAPQGFSGTGVRWLRSSSLTVMLTTVGATVLLCHPLLGRYSVVVRHPP